IHSEATEMIDEAPLMANVGLMDGALYDKQGVDSILLSENRLGSTAYDLIIVSDLTSPYMHPFKFMEDKGDKGWRKWNYSGIKHRVQRFYRRIKWVLLSLAIIAAVLLISNRFADSILSGIALSVGTLALFLFFVVQWFG